MESQPVSTQVVRRIKAGQEEAFERTLKEFFVKAKPIPGQLSVNVVKPAVGSRDWGILRTFASESHRDQFFASETFRDYEQYVSQFVEGDSRVEHLCGLETWFTAPGAVAIIPPPRWKMAIVTFFGVYFTSTLVGLLLGPSLQSLPNWLSSAVAVAITVACLTWLVMPNLSRLLRPWLSPRTSAK
jgi:antibiotic biosynthesis monooxygenase (ABM) superfamily enzyme